MMRCKTQELCRGIRGELALPGTDRLREGLEDLYRRYNHRSFVHPDPLEFLYDYPDVRDREVVGFVGASLAYGRVAQILRKVSLVLERMGFSPRAFLDVSSERTLRRTFSDFKHRFTTGEELANALWGLREAIRRYGSLQGCFTAHLRPEDDTILPALCAFVSEICGEPSRRVGALLSSPKGASACKKLNLFLRWMVRRDAVDPGGWDAVPASKLVVPVDVHMHRVGLGLGMTRRRQADMRTALEITEGFRKIFPSDPVRYDFVLTRPGIWGDDELQRSLNGLCSLQSVGERI
jgi:uncharacterized protein (TIGR02757 family)